MFGDDVLATGRWAVEENQVGEESLSGVNVDLILVLFTVDVPDFAELLVEIDGLASLLMVGGETLLDSFSVVISSLFLGFSS
jgi:hypothetical protein